MPLLESQLNSHAVYDKFPAVLSHLLVVWLERMINMTVRLEVTPSSPGTSTTPAAAYTPQYQHNGLKNALGLGTLETMIVEGTHQGPFYTIGRFSFRAAEGKGEKTIPEAQHRFCTMV